MHRNGVGAVVGTMLCGFLAACGPAKPDGPPIVAIETDNGTTVMSGRLSKTFELSNVSDISADGRFLVERFDDDSVSYRLGRVGTTIATKPLPSIDTREFGQIALGDEGVIAVDRTKAGAGRLRVFDRNLKLTRSVGLPGKNLGRIGLASESDHYGNAIQVGDSIFLHRTHWKDVDATADAIVRIDPDDSLHVLHRNKHVSGLTASADGQSLLATIDESAPYYEGGPANRSIVELDADTGKIAASYGLPPTCKHYRSMGEAAGCVVNLDKVDGKAAAQIYENTGQREPIDAILTTWIFTDGAWNEVKSQRGKRVSWLDRDTRIEETAPNLFSGDRNDVFMLDAGKRNRLGKEGVWTGWDANGSLIRP